MTARVPLLTFVRSVVVLTTRRLIRLPSTLADPSNVHWVPGTNGSQGLSIVAGSVKLAGTKTSVMESSPAVRTPWDAAGELGSGAVDCGAAGDCAAGAADDVATGTKDWEAVADGPTTVPQAELDRTHNDTAAAEMIR